jgi:hypothetical protein
LIVSATSF